MYHSITIGGKNTWRDWHLIPSSRPLFNPPKIRTNYVDVPGSDGSIDLSDIMIGRPTYENRSGTWDFYVDNGYGTWSDRYSEIMAHLNGEKMTAVLEDDPMFYYEGRFSVNEWRSDPYYSRISINYIVGPYKLASVMDGDDWLWDPFNFNTDPIRSYRNMTVKKSSPLVVRITGDVMDIYPLITTATNDMQLDFNNKKYYLKRGSYTYDGVVLTEGENVLTFTYTGSASSSKVSLKMTGGRF